MPRLFKVPANVKANARLFLDSVKDSPEELLGLANMALAERLSTGEIDEPTFKALESYSESVNWNSKLHGNSPESNALLSIGGRGTRQFISESILAVETAIEQDLNSGLEPDGSYIRRILIASPGLGSTGYYPESALRVSESAFPKGTNMLNAHVRQLERVQKSGLSMDDLVGETIEDARFDNHPADGPGLYTRIRIFPKVVERLGLEVVKKSQFSIYTQALFEPVRKMMKGRLVPVIKKLINTRTTSIDAVMIAGRGGKLVAESGGIETQYQVVAESANGWLDSGDDLPGGTQLVVISPVPDEMAIEKGTDGAQEENHMTLEEAKALIEVLKAEKATLVTAVESHNATVEGMNQTIRSYQAVEAVRSTLGSVKFVSEEARKLVVESVMHSVGFGEDGNVNTDALKLATESYTSGSSELVVSEDATPATPATPVAAESGSFFTPLATGIGQVAETFSAPKTTTTSAPAGTTDAANKYLSATKDIKF